MVSTSLFHTNTKLFKDPESKAEKTVNLLKENILEVKKKNEEAKIQVSQSSIDNLVNQKSQTNQVADVQLTIWQRVVKECKHYYHGFKLLYFETKIALLN